MDWFIRYDTRLKDRARNNRKNPTPAEKLTWDKLFSNKQFHGYKFTRQKMLAWFIVDFYCSELQLVVEIDGEIHNYQEDYDNERMYMLQESNLKIFRYSNEEIIWDIWNVYRNLTQNLWL